MSRAVPLLLREIAYRRWNFLLSLCAVVMAVALFAAFYTAGKAQERETRRVTRDLGFNLRIVPKTTDLNRLYARGFSGDTMPEDAVDRLASRDNISYNHLVATLEREIDVGGENFVVTGLSPERTPGGKKKPMSFSIEEGSVHLGFLVAERVAARRGDTIEILGRRFRVERTLTENGTPDDRRIFASLADVQALLGLQGKISEIKAIDCLCLMPDENPLRILRSQIESAVPEAKVVMLGRLAETRARQRRMVERYVAYILPSVLVVCAVWIAALSALNVRERRHEIGVLQALGHGARLVLGLFLGRAALVGLAGAALGYPLGCLLAFTFGAEIFPVTAESMRWSYGLLGVCLGAAPLFAVVSSFIPAVAAATRDPATSLRIE